MIKSYSGQLKCFCCLKLVKVNHIHTNDSALTHDLLVGGYVLVLCWILLSAYNTGHGGYKDVICCTLLLPVLWLGMSPPNDTICNLDALLPFWRKFGSVWSNTISLCLWSLHPFSSCSKNSLPSTAYLHFKTASQVTSVWGSGRWTCLIYTYCDISYRELHLGPLSTKAGFPFGFRLQSIATNVLSFYPLYYATVLLSFIYIIKIMLKNKKCVQSITLFIYKLA